MTVQEFRFVVSDINLTPAQIKQVGQAVVQAGALALADLTPEDAVTLEVRPGVFWRGLPPAPTLEAIKAHAVQQLEVAEQHGDAR
jgi:hypothetical protein